MKKYTSPKSNIVPIEESAAILASSNSFAFSYFNRAQANEIRKVFAHIYSSLSLRQKSGLAAIMSNFVIEAGQNKKDVQKAYEFYIISIGLTECEIQNIFSSKPFENFDDMIACVRIIGDHRIYRQLIIVAQGFVIKANSDVGWGMFEEVCESLGYSKRQVEDLLSENRALVNHFSDSRYL